MRRTTLFGLVILAGVACAGRDFVRPAPESLVLGQTTYAQIIARLGSPERRGTKTVNEQSVTTISYSFASLGGGALVDGVTPTRAMTFYFLDGVLVGHEFASSYKDDHTDFDESKAREFRKGETTRERVIRMLGAPHGEYARPLIKNRSDRAVVYLYAHVKGSGVEMKVYEKVLTVSVDSSGVVTEIDFRSQGQR